ncbi:hypothetical protein FHS37_001876 [Streptomyces griseostramineus]|uniref:Uncharacterized protein n=1 Tax=Streptomyces griseomycini TaxID=66895 RepID=A0A7W7LY17_9ACTN|nr:hypothetical protein [Streptomyces griseomycini]
MRLRRGVVVAGLVVRNGVVATVVGPGVTGSGEPGPVPVGRPALLRARGPVEHLGLPGLLPLVRLGGRQREHRAGRGLLRRRALGGGGQRAPTPPRRLRLFLDLGGPGRVGRRGQRRRQGVLLAGRAPGTSAGGRGHPLRRYGPAQPRVRRCGPRRMLGGGDDGPLGDPGTTGTRTGDLDRTSGGGRRVLGRPPTPPPGAAGHHRALAGRRGRKLCRRGLVGGGRRPAPAPSGGRRALRPGGVVRARHLALQEGVHGGTPCPSPSAAGGQRGVTGRSGLPVHRCDGHRGGRDGSRPAADRHLQDERAAAHPRHLVRLQHAAVRPDDPAHDRLVHRVAAAVRAAHLDADDLAALRRRDHDGVVQVTARRDGGVAGRVDARDVRDEVREGGREQPGVDLGLDGRRVHGELHPPGTDELHRPVHAGGDDGVEHHLRPGDALGPGVEALVAEDVVDEGGDAGVAGRQVVEHLVGLGPQLPGVVRGQRGQLAAQFLQWSAQGLPEQGEQLVVPGGEGLVAVLLALTEGGVPLLVRGELLRVLLAQLLHLGDVALAQGGELRAVLLGEALQLLGVLPLGGLLLLDERVVGAPVGEGHDGADELVAVAHRRGRQVDRDLVAALGVQHLPAHPVLAPGAQGVGERGLVVGEGGAVGARVQDERVQLAPAELAGPVAQYLGGGRVHEDDPAVGVGPHDALGRGPQDHLGLPLRARQLRLGVDGAGEVADDEHQQLVAGVAVGVVGLLAGLQIRTGDLDRELGPVGPPGDHPRRLGPRPGVDVVGPPHGPRDELGVELRQQIQQPPPHQSRARGLEGLQGDGVRVDDGPVGVDQHQGVGKRVQYGCEASSASGWPAAHETLPPCYRDVPTARAILPIRPQRVTRGSLRAGVALATPDGTEVARGSDGGVTSGSPETRDGLRRRRPNLRRTFTSPAPRPAGARPGARPVPLTGAPRNAPREAAGRAGPSGRSRTRPRGRTSRRRGARPRCR